MIRKVVWMMVTAFVFVSTLAAPVHALAYTVTSEDRVAEPIAAGVEIETITQYTTDGTLKIYAMKVDLTNPYVKINSMVGSGGKLTSATSVTKMVTDSGAVAGINGDFFQMDEKAPIGLTVQSGNLVSSPAQRTDMYGFGLTTANVPMINIFSFEGKVTTANGNSFPLFGVNKPTYLTTGGASPDKDKLNLYTPVWGEKSRGKLSGQTETVEVVVQNDTVTEIRTNLPGVTIPQNGYVLSANGQAAQWVKLHMKAGTGLTVNYGIKPDGELLEAAVGGQAMLVAYGKRSWFTQNITGKRPRTAVGYTQDRKTMFLVVVEGGGSSRGMTQEELADFMVSLGCWQAINLDGGGSSTMSARRLGDTNISLLNKPSAGSQRAVPNGLGIFSTAPAGAFAGLKVSGDRFLLVGTSRPYVAKGYDEYYNPYKVESYQINWDIDPAIGSFEGNVLKAESSGQAKLVASFNGISQEYDVRILGAADISKIEIAPAIIELNEGDSTNLTVTVTAKNGVKFNLQAGEVQWEVVGDVGSVTGASFKAGATKAVGQLKATVDGFTTSIPVSVGAVEKPFSGFDAYKDFGFSGYPAEITGLFRATTDKEPTFRGTGAGVLEYDLTKAVATGAAYGRFGETGLKLPGRPLGLALWVYGNGSNSHWLRAKIVDANGAEKLIDLAKSPNWQGWRQVSGKFPSGLKYPVELQSIYVVETDPSKTTKGKLIMDELSLLMPVNKEDLTAGNREPQTVEVVDARNGIRATLGDYLEVNAISNAINTDTVILSEQLVLDKPTPGASPVLPAFRIAGGNDVTKLNQPVNVSYKYKGKGDIKNMRLRRWDATSQNWVSIPQRVDHSKNTIIAKVDTLGQFAVVEEQRPTPVFNDIDSSWAKSQIEEMASIRAVSGFPGNKFLPANGVTRAEFVVLLANLFGWTAQNPNITFKDDLPSWAKGAIAAGVEKGVVKGYGDGTFQPAKKITRAEMAVIIDNCLKLRDSDQPSAYNDAAKIPTWAVQAIRNTKESGLLKGNNNSFRPQATASRAEATTVLYNIRNYYIPLDSDAIN